MSRKKNKINLYMPKVDLKSAIKQSGGDELDYLDIVEPGHWECYCGSCIFFGEDVLGVCSKHQDWDIHSETSWNYNTHILSPINKKCDDFYN